MKFTNHENYKKLIEFYVRIMKINISLFHAMITKILKIKEFPTESWKSWKSKNSPPKKLTVELTRIPIENHEHLKNLRILMENQENIENLNIVLENQ